MHPADRELLARLQRLNREGLPQSVMAMLDTQQDGYLLPDGLRALAEVFTDLALAMRARADVIERPPPENQRIRGSARPRGSRNDP
jgi:hypothetical protein